MLETHLAPLRRQGLIRDWHDRKILPGHEWDKVIDKNLESSQVILLLVSPDFVASDYCYDRELKRALDKHEQGQARVIPVILRPTDWAGTPFSKLQALPENARPVTTWPNRDLAWLDVVKGVRKAIEEVREFSGSQEAPEVRMEQQEPDLTPRSKKEVDAALTPRELEVLKRLAEEKGSLQIARELKISRVTAKAHIESTLRKLGTPDRAEAVVKALESGILSGDEAIWSAARSRLLKAVHDQWSSGKTSFNETDIQKAGNDARLNLAATKRLLMKLVSSDGPIVGNTIASEEGGLIGISVTDVSLYRSGDLAERVTLEPENPKVFIGHASEDKERFVLGFARNLYSNGIEAWVDEWEIRPGDSLVRKIFDDGIGQAEAVIIVLSEYSVNKPWVREELNVSTVRRIEDGVKLIPVLIGNVENHQIPTSLRDTVWIRVENLNEYAAQLNTIVDTVYSRREKPPLGQKPEYTRADFGVVSGLSPSDSMVLKLCCEMEVEGGQRKATVEPSAVIEEAVGMGLHHEQILESMEILDSRGYLKATHVIGSKAPYSLTVTKFGFNEYARNYLPGYDSLVRAVGLQIVNHEEDRVDAIAEAVGTSIVIVEHILETFEDKGFVSFLRETGPLHISRVSPELKRWLQEH